MLPHSHSHMRTAGAMSAIAGLFLTAVPLAAHAEPAPLSVSQSVTVVVADSNTIDSAEAPLPGAHLTVFRSDDMDTAVTSTVTGNDGTAIITLDNAEDTSYIIDASYPGFTSDGQSWLSRAEFNPMGEAPASVIIDHSFGLVSGTVSGTIDDGAVTDFSGAQLSIFSGSTEVQRVALAADGSFTSGALLTSEDPSLPDESTGGVYSLAFVPTDALQLADEQPDFNPAFSVPSGSASPSSVTVAPRYAFVGSTPAPEPEPTTDPSPEPKPAPETPNVPSEPTNPNKPANPASPAPELTMDPYVPRIPPFTGPSIDVPGNNGQATLQGALNALNSGQFNNLIGLTSESTSPVFITSGTNQVLGVAFPIPDGIVSPTAALLQRGLSRVSLIPNNASNINGVVVAGLPAIGTALQSLQSNRESQLDNQLSAQIAAINSLNVQIAEKNDLLSAINGFLAALPADGCPDLTTTSCASIDASLKIAQSAVLKAQVEDPFTDIRVTTTADFNSARIAADSLVNRIKGEIDSLSNSQQMDMLRVQSLINKRNEAFDVITDFIDKMKDSKSSIIGNMRSEPVSIGTVQWNRGKITGAFNLSQVPAGNHHAILEFKDLGLTVISAVTVPSADATSDAPTLAETGSRVTVPAIAGASLIVLGAFLFMSASKTSRRRA